MKELLVAHPYGDTHANSCPRGRHNPRPATEVEAGEGGSEWTAGILPERVGKGSTEKR